MRHGYGETVLPQLEENIAPNAPTLCGNSAGLNARLVTELPAQRSREGPSPAPSRGAKPLELNALECLIVLTSV